MKLWKIMAVLCLPVPLAAQVQLGRNVKIGTGGAAGIETQTNGVENLSQTLLDLVQGTNVTLTNTSGGHVRVDSSVSGDFQQQVIPPVTGQYVVIYPTSVVATDVQRATVVTSPGSIGAQVSFRIGCGGLTECSAILTWSGFTLPSYVDPASVTAIYVFGNYSGGEMTLSHASYTPPLTDAFLSDAAFGTPMHQSTSLTTLTGAQVAGSTLQWVFDRTLPVDIGIIPNANIASVGLIVYYTGPAPPANTSIIVDPPLFFNGTSLDLGIDPLAINFLQPLTAGQLPAASAASGDIYQVTDGTSSSDCTTGGGSTVNLCRSNGTIWTIFTSGGGGGGAWSSLTNPTGNLSLAMGADTSTFTFGTNTGTTPWMQWVNSSGVGWGIAPDGSLRGVGSSATHGMTLPAGTTPSPTASAAGIYTDASGNLQFSDAGGAFSRPCTVGNYASVCPSAGSSPLTTKGDLYGFSTANARVPVGSDGQVLTADSTQTLGVKWAAGGGGGSAFSALTSGTNTTAAMLVGTGASLAPTGTGTIQATNIANTLVAGSGATLTGSGTVASPYSIALSGSGGSATVASAEVVAFSATPTFSTSFNVSRIVLTGNVTSFTLGAGSDGQDKKLCFKQGTGPYTVVAPANVHGFFTIGNGNALWSCQAFAYDNTDSIWMATSAGVINQ